MSQLHIVFDNPVIPTNTGNAIRTAAVTGATLHLIEPLGFNFDDKHLKRAGLDYHDLADLQIHKDFQACMDALPGARVFAFTTHTTKWFTDVEYRDGDVLLRHRAHRPAQGTSRAPTHHRAGPHSDDARASLDEPVERRLDRRLRGVAPAGL